MLIAQIVVYAAILYLLIGIFFAAYFVYFKVAEMDESAKGTGIGFKLLIFFGAVPFWSFLLYRTITGSRVPLEKNAHRRCRGERK